MAESFFMVSVIAGLLIELVSFIEVVSPLPAVLDELQPPAIVPIITVISIKPKNFLFIVFV